MSNAFEVANPLVPTDAAVKHGSAFSRNSHASVTLNIDYKALAFRQNRISSAFEGPADYSNRRGRWKQRTEHYCSRSHFAAMTDAADTVTAIWKLRGRPHRNTRKINSDSINHDP